MDGLAGGASEVGVRSRRERGTSESGWWRRREAVEVSGVREIGVDEEVLGDMMSGLASCGMVWWRRGREE